MTKLLLDTHVLLFAFSKPAKLGATAKSLILNPSNNVYFSVASAWKVAIKNARHPDQMPYTINDFLGCCKKAGYRELPITAEHVRMLRVIDSNHSSPIHSDPFNRMLICQTRSEDMLFLTQDSKILNYNFGNIIDSRL